MTSEGGPRLGRLRIIANPPGYIVIASLLIACIGLVGNAPGAPFHEQEREPHYPHLFVGAAPKETLSDVSINADMPILHLYPQLPLWPWGHAKFTGYFQVIGTKKKPGQVDLALRLPSNSTITSVEGKALLEPAQLPAKYEDKGIGDEGREILLSFITTKAGQLFSVFMRFELTEPSFSQALGWGRQRFIFTYRDFSSDNAKPFHWLSGSKERKVPAVRLQLSGTDYEYVRDVAPEAVTQFRGATEWIMRSGQVSYFQATVENTWARYLAELAPQVFFLGLGVLLARATFRVRRIRIDKSGD